MTMTHTQLGLGLGDFGGNKMVRLSVESWPQLKGPKSSGYSPGHYEALVPGQRRPTQGAPTGPTGRPAFPHGRDPLAPPEKKGEKKARWDVVGWFGNQKQARERERERESRGMFWESSCLFHVQRRIKKTHATKVRERERVLGCVGMCWDVLGCVGMCWDVLGILKMCHFQGKRKRATSNVLLFQKCCFFVGYFFLLRVNRETPNVPTNGIVQTSSPTCYMAGAES